MGKKISMHTRQTVWNNMCAEIRDCKECVLWETRNKAVVFRGNPFSADWCFVAEAPGEDEDIRGKVLVGPSGKLFNKFLADCKMPVDKWVAINVLNCRPPKNKFPKKDVAAICPQRYLWLKLDLIRPKFIVAMGKNAAAAFIKDINKMGSVAGQAMDPLPKWKADYLKKVFITYHPAYALRQGHAVGVIRSHMRFFMAYTKNEGLR